jgi:hypothetical protein
VKDVCMYTAKNGATDALAGELSLRVVAEAVATACRPPEVMASPPTKLYR